MNKNKLKKLLEACLWELDNLSRKIANGELEGWEGSKRRLILKMDIKETIKLINYKVT